MSESAANTNTINSLGNEVSVGIDIGSTASKAAVISDGQLVHTLCIPTGFSGVDASERLRDQLEAAGVDFSSAKVVATGYGRVSVPYADKTVTEITCHAKGAAHLFEPDGIVIDIGGQDLKVIHLKGGKVGKFTMNDKCSAGTGKFIEVMANRLGVTLQELEHLASTGKETHISSMCTVFAESEVISLIGLGTPKEDIAWGVINSVAAKVAPMVGNVDGSPLFLTGGLCECPYILEVLSTHLKQPISTCKEARFAGAIGAALSA